MKPSEYATKIVLDAYGPGPVLGQVAAMVVLTLLGQGLTVWVPDLAAPWGAATPFPWVWLAISALLLVPSRWFLTNRPGWFSTLYVLQSCAQAIWLLGLVWESTFPVAVLCMLQLMGWLFSDVRYVPESVVVRTWDIVGPSFFLVTLARDAWGAGWIAAWQRDSQMAISWIVVLAIGSLFLSWAARFLVARHRRIKELEEAERSQNKLSARLVAERGVVQRLGRLLADGVSGARFRHDVAGPVQVVAMGAREISDYLHGASAQVPDEEVKAMARDVVAAANTVMELTKGLSVSGASPADTIVSILEIVEGAALQFEGDLAARGVKMPILDVQVSPALVVGSMGYVSVLANLTVNAALVRENQTILWRGFEADGRYLFEIVDEGVSEEEMPRALRVVRSHLAVVREDDIEVRSGSYRGFGAGLLLCRLEVLRHGGEVEVIPNTGRRGLTLRLVLPLDPLDPITPQGDS